LFGEGGAFCVSRLEASLKRRKRRGGGKEEGRKKKEPKHIKVDLPKN